MNTLTKRLWKCISYCFPFRKKIKQESLEKQPIEANSERETSYEVNSERETTIEANSERETSNEVNSERETTVEANSEIETSNEVNSERETTVEANSEIETTNEVNSERETTVEANSEIETSNEVNSERETTVEANSERETTNEVNSERETTVEAKKKRETTTKAHRKRKAANKSNSTRKTAKKPNVSPERDKLYCDECVSRQKRCFEDQVKTAVAKKNVFWTDFKGSNDFERGLLSRGWVKKIAPTFNAGPKKTIFCDPTYGHEIISRYDIQPNLILTRQRIELHLLKEDQITNHFYGVDATSKSGLCNLLRQWCLSCDANPHTFFPRCYMFSEKNEKQAFIDDFTMTAACGILKWVLRTNGKSLQDEVIPSRKEKKEKTAFCMSDAKINNHGPARIVPEDIIVTALVACQFHLYDLTHEDEDDIICAGIVDRKHFISDYYRVMHHGAHIQNSDKYVDYCHQLLCKLRRVNPQLDIDGEKNIWISKPRALSRGRGIRCRNDLKDICSLGWKWVVQKYIERPLLVYGTKFDLRQHFLITDWHPLTIWFYKHSFLRFSSQPFTLERLDTAIHVCNNSIQRKLKNAPNRHPNLPEENMWHSDEFKEYLCTIGKEQVWDSIIIPGMKKALIHSMKATRENVKYKKNSYDLFGSDFLFGENFQPWLLEIQYKPDITKDTPVMKKIVPPMVEDILRVVIDYKDDPNCNVGGFELIYKQANYTGNVSRSAPNTRTDARHPGLSSYFTS
ncbi:tubulin monoglycylase TTLL3-like isoform X3 [Xenopus laevis]|uniref:Tubulin monoglycylase TTLL3-like isoform X3 n=1 Tax=Xenopus laevis TaxID=8355 RepID=A0A8J1MPK0_XENLA|nr:tubulin monoglycylase TTLL3-like isoform X3 [Xenopus laevis]